MTSSHLCGFQRPPSPDSPTSRSRLRADPGAGESSLDGMRVLVAEDDRGLREVLVEGLEEAGYQVDAVGRGDDAVEQLRFYDYDVAVLDWRMPGMAGIEVVAWAREH